MVVPRAVSGGVAGCIAFTVTVVRAGMAVICPLTAGQVVAGTPGLTVVLEAALQGGAFCTAWALLRLAHVGLVPGLTRRLSRGGAGRRCRYSRRSRRTGPDRVAVVGDVGGHCPLRDGDRHERIRL